MFRSIKNKLILGVLAGFLIPYALGTVYIQDYTDNWLLQSSVEDNCLILGALANRVDEAFIYRMEEQVSMLSIDERVVSGKGKVRNYLTLGGYPSASEIGSDEKSIEKLFASMKSTHENIGFIFYGLEDGGYIEYPSFNPTGSYDPRTRQWYKNALSKQDVTVSEPYMSSVTQALVVSFTKPVLTKDGLSGIIGVSVELEQLKNSINDIKLGETGYIIVLDDNDNIIVHPSNESWLTLNANEVLTKDKNYLNLEHMQVKEYRIDDAEMVVQSHVSKDTGWKYISVIPKNELLKQSNDLTDILFYVYIMVSLLIFAITVLIANRLISPINDLDQAVGKMAEFDFEGTEKVIQSYSGQNDEIGTITKSLGLMKNNIQKHLITIEKQNKDIMEKNEELITSEEELLSQLSQIDEQQAYIKFLAYHDPLTSLPNRLGFNNIATEMLIQNEPAVVGLLDLDNFKIINDTLGHIFGDKVLKSIGERLLNLQSDTLVVSRFGGDEFLLLSRQESSEKDIESFVQTISRVFEDAIQIDGNKVSIEYSTGFSVYPSHSKDINQLIMNADMALYSVKESHKGSYAIFNESMNKQMVAKTEIERVLKEALINDGFSVLFQPLVELESGTIKSFEVLLRLKNGSFGPDEFIPVAEETGLIGEIGRRVVHLALEHLNEWKESGQTLRPISINFSPLQVHDTEFVDYLAGELKKYNIDGSLIHLEITESVFFANKDKAVDILKQLRAQGVKISIDDFGTGFSSLSYLSYLPVDCIKLDKSLCEKFLDLSNIQVMDSLIQLSHSLNLTVVAEGIEDLEQVKRLVVGKCDLVQGYYFSKPLEFNQAFELINKNYKGLYQKKKIDEVLVMVEHVEIL